MGTHQLSGIKDQNPEPSGRGRQEEQGRSQGQWGTFRLDGK